MEPQLFGNEYTNAQKTALLQQERRAGPDTAGSRGRFDIPIEAMALFRHAGGGPLRGDDGE